MNKNTPTKYIKFLTKTNAKKKGDELHEFREYRVHNMNEEEIYTLFAIMEHDVPDGYYLHTWYPDLITEDKVFVFFVYVEDDESYDDPYNDWSRS
jgi:hypothetical protein